MVQSGIYRYARTVLVVVVTVVLTACGGGGGGDGVLIPDPDPNNPSPSLPSNTQIVENPPGLTKLPTATFRFESNSAENSYQVRIDDADFVTVSNPYETGNLSDGNHTLLVRAVNAQNNADPNPVSYTWTIDTTGPVISLSQSPAVRTTATQASFEFTANEVAQFQASIDKAPFVPVTSPYVFESPIGPHSISFKAADSLENIGQLEHIWEVVAAVATDTTPPNTTISSAPATLTREKRATFIFTANEADVKFQGLLDGIHSVSVTSPHEINDLVDGEHTFEVRAIDLAANSDPTPAVVRWTVDSTPPITTLSTRPNAITDSRSATFEFTANENSKFFARIDDDPPSLVTSPLTIQNLIDGPHRIEISAEDTAENRDASPEIVSWTVDATLPVVGVLFPPSQSLTDADQITLVGTASDPAGITVIRINGNDAGATSTNGFANWRTSLPLSVGDNQFTIESVDSGGQRSQTATLSVRRSENILERLGTMTYDAVNRRLLAVANNRVISLDVTTGRREVIASDTIGTGDALQVPRVLAVDGINNRAWVTDQDGKSLVSINLTTRARAIVADTTNPNIALEGPYGLAVNLTTQTAYVADRVGRKIVAIDLKTGLRTLVSSATRGDGPAFGILDDLVLDTERNRVLVATTDVNVLTPNKIVAIDLTTGDRSELRGPGLGTGLAFLIKGLAIDTANSRALVSDNISRQLVAVDLNSGNRSPLPSGGTSSLLRSPDSLVVNPADNVIYVGDSLRNTVVEINTQTGAHRHASDDVSGSGPIFGFVQDIGIAGTDIFALETDPFRIIRYDSTTGTRTVAVENTAGASFAVAEAYQLATDPANRRLFITGRRRNQTAASILSFNLANNSRRIVLTSFSSLARDHTDPVISSLLYDAGSDRLFTFVPFLYDPANVLDMDSVWSINPTNGAGRQLVGANATLRLAADQTAGALDLGRGVLYAHDQLTGRILRINATTGATAEAAMLTTGSPNLGKSSGLAVDTALNRAYVGDADTNTLYEVVVNGPQSGARTESSSISRGRGPSTPTFYALSTGNGVVWVFDVGRYALMAIDPISGDRVIASR